MTHLSLLEESEYAAWMYVYAVLEQIILRLM
jgi:hypothetical protein